MYYVIFYVGMVLSAVAFIYSIIYFKKNNIKGCIKDILRLFAIALAFIAGTLVISNNNNELKIIHEKPCAYTENEISEGGQSKDSKVENTGEGTTENKNSEPAQVEEDNKPIIDVSIEDESVNKCLVENSEDIKELEICYSTVDVELKVKITGKNDLATVVYTVGEEETTLTEYGEEGFVIPVTQTAKTPEGIPVTITATDIEGNIGEYKGSVYIDKESPVIGDYTYSNGDKEIKKIYGCIFCSETIGIKIPLSDACSGVDKESVKAVFVEEGNDNTAIELSVDREVEDGCLVNVLFDGGMGHCSGYVEVTVNDKAGNSSVKKSARIIYNKNEPVISLDIENAVEKWTNRDVNINLKVNTRECGIKKLSIYVVGEKVMEEKPDKLMPYYEGVIKMDKTAKKHTGYSIEVRVTDNCGNESRKKCRLYIDKEDPKLTISGAYDNSYHKEDVLLNIGISDVSYTETKVVYYVKRSIKNVVYDDVYELPTPKDYSDSYELRFIKEGAYEVYAKAIDGAGNESVTGEIHFVIDKTLPEIAFYGVKNDAVANKVVKLGVLCEDDFYESVDTHIDIKRKIDGKTYTEEPQVFEHSKRLERRNIIISDDGEYEVTFSAKDKAGNESDVEVIHFIVDTTAPDIKVSGFKQYRLYDGKVSVKIGIDEEFYRDSKVVLRAVKTDMDDNERKLDIPQVSLYNKYSVQNLNFNEDGMYHLSVLAKDAAGNKTVKTYQFLIDSKAPIISGVENYDGKYYKTLSPQKEAPLCVSDLTLKDYQLLLNGIEYDGVSEIEKEGKYVLNAKATDELGHMAERSAEFIIDNTAPEIAFYGVMDGQTVDKEGVVRWELINSDDTIDKILINGKEGDASLRELRYNTGGTYNIVINSVDKAGNRGVSELQFQYTKPGALAHAMPGVVNREDSPGKHTFIITVISLLGIVIISAGIYCFRQVNNNGDQRKSKGE